MALRFLAKLAAFVLLFGVAVPGALWRHGGLQRWAIGSEVYAALAAARAVVPDARAIVIGDSVAHQLYEAGRPVAGLHSLACNQAISFAGHYLLLKTFADRNEMRGRTVYLVVTPSAFAADLHDKYTFHYFLKPFYGWGEQPELTPLVRSRIAEVPYHLAALLPIVKMSSWSPGWDEPPSPAPVSAVALESLVRMRELAAERGFTLRVVAPFVPPPAVATAERVVAAVTAAGVGELLEGYAPEARVLPGASFVDPFHLRDPRALGENPLRL
jgi:hypothetical protein